MATDSFSLSRFFLRNFVLGIVVLTAPFAYVVFEMGKADLMSVSERHSVAVAKHLSFEIQHEFLRSISETVESFQWSEPTSIARLDEIARAYLSHLDVTKINIFDLHRCIVYSTNPELIGKCTETNQKLIEALGGSAVSGLELARESPDIEHDTHAADLLETYVPFRVLNDDWSEGAIVGAFEIYQDVTATYQQIVKLRNIVLGTSVLILLLFVLTLRLVVARADRIQAGLREEIESYADNLERMVGERTSELKEQKNRLQIILDNVPSAFVLLDGQLRIEMASAALRKISGQDPADVVGMHCRTALCQRDEHDDCPARQALEDRRLASCVVSHSGEEGEERFFEHVAVPIGRDGEACSVLAIITDVTAKKHLQDAIIQAEKLSAVGQMSATLAHEVRNALTSVKLTLQHLAQSDKLGGQEAEATRLALDSIGDMEHLVQDLLAFARPRPGLLEPRDLNELARQSVHFCRQQINSKGLVLREEYDADMPLLSVDSEHLKESIVNLLLNAIQASGEGSALEVATEVRVLASDISDFSPGHEEGIHLRRGQRVAAIRIADTAGGIPGNQLKRIFEPFFTTKADGTGLGLTVARRIANDHGGVLTVDSDLNRGSTFSLILPV